MLVRRIRLWLWKRRFCREMQKALDGKKKPIMYIDEAAILKNPQGLITEKDIKRLRCQRFI